MECIDELLQENSKLKNQSQKFDGKLYLRKMCDIQ